MGLWKGEIHSCDEGIFFVVVLFFVVVFCEWLEEINVLKSVSGTILTGIHREKRCSVLL